LDLYNSAIADLGTKLSSLHESFSINATQVSELNQKLIPLINNRLSLLNSSVQARQNIGFSAASDIIASDQGKVVMDQIRKRINSMINLEESLLKSRTTLSIVKQQNLLNSTLIGVLVSSSDYIIGNLFKDPVQFFAD
jgi:CHASE3 domain sensor protein